LLVGGNIPGKLAEAQLNATLAMQRARSPDRLRGRTGSFATSAPPWLGSATGQSKIQNVLLMD
jgi:hypothetical protein